MFKRLTIAAALVLMTSTTGYADNECVKEWNYKLGIRKVLTISACRYARGKSGFYKVDNLANYPVRVCWEIEFNNQPKARKYCRVMKAKEISTASCYSCNPVSGGVKNIRVTSYDRK